MSYVSNLVHFIWSTARREPLIDPEWQGQLYAYIGGILNNKKAKLLCAGGVADHVHLYVSLPSTLSLAEAAGVMKANSSRWIHEQFPSLAAFSWQDGYAAFTVSVSGDAAVRTYLLNQAVHHRVRSFQEELIEFLERHQIPYDPKYVFL